MARKKNNTVEETDTVTVDPMETVIDQMPEPSTFADTILPPAMEDDGLDGNGEKSESFSFDDSPPSTNGESAGESNATETFDPNIHCVDENGNPKRTKSGKYRRKRGKAGATAMPSPNQIDPVRMANAQIAAQVSTQATFVAGQIAFGPEGAAMENEAEQMIAAYTQFFYLSEKPIQIQPWVLVAMVSCAYIAKRMAMEEPRNRVMRGLDWIQEKTATVWRFFWGS